MWQAAGHHTNSRQLRPAFGERASDRPLLLPSIGVRGPHAACEGVHVEISGSVEGRLWAQAWCAVNVGMLQGHG
jgi:hypothetical protein